MRVFWQIILTLCGCSSHHLISSKNLYLSQPSVVTIQGYQDPLWIGSSILRESRHTHFISLNMNPGHYFVSYPKLSNKEFLSIQVDPGQGNFDSSDRLTYPIWIDHHTEVLISNISMYAPYGSYYSYSLAYRFLQYPSLLDIPISMEENLRVYLRLDGRLVYQESKSKNSLLQRFVFLEKGHHEIKLTAQLTRMSCYHRPEYGYCEPVRYVLFPPANTGFESFARLGIWKQDETSTKKISNLLQDSLVENIQNHLHYLLPEGKSSDFDIDLL